MAHYSVHFAGEEMAVGMQSPMTAAEAYERIRELQSQGITNITLRNYETGDEISDVERLLRDPDA